MADQLENEERLFGEFSSPSYQEWQEAAVASLKGAPFEKLLSKTYEGITLQPIYRQEDAAELTHQHTLPGAPPYVRGAEALGYVAAPWAIAQALPHGAAKEVNEALRHDLARGQTAVVLDGEQAQSAAEVAEALEGIDLAKLPLYVQTGAGPLPAAAVVVAGLRRAGMEPAGLRGCIGGDPLGVLAAEGELSVALERAYDEAAQWTAWAAEYAPELGTVAVRGDIYGDAGAHAGQELAFALATGVAYLRALQARGVDVEVSAPRMRFTFALGSNFFMEVAKLRAARLLWSQVAAAFGGSAEAQKMAIHARTGSWNKTTTDPYVNMLRSTTEAFSGALGGVSSMEVAPFDAVVGGQSEFSRRIARNVQLILQEECNLTRLIDPAGGSWYVEKLTDELAHKAWALFQEIERRGGMAAALAEGYVQAQTAETAKQRSAALSTRKDVLVGTNMYANAQEQPPAAQGEGSQGQAARAEGPAGVWQADGGSGVDAAIAAAEQGATAGQLASAMWPAAGAAERVTPLRRARGAEPFEVLRRAAHAHGKRTGGAPQVFLANMGPGGQHKARAEFSQGFFEVGGFQVINNKGFATAEAAADAALAAGAPVVVICSTDETYPELVAPLVKRIKEARPETAVVLAGYPQEQVEAHRAAGVDEFIHVRANCHEVNRRLLERIGAAVYEDQAEVSA